MLIQKNNISHSDPRQTLRNQIFWVGENKEKLGEWYSYVCRTPQLVGHIILANKKEYSKKSPEGFQEALNLNINFILEWAKKNKSKDCHPIFFRMNIQKEQFRVHILPVSQKEIQEASHSLHQRVPGLNGNGGFIYYLGQKEEVADQRQVKFNELTDGPLVTENLMKELGITKIVEELREIVRRRGYSYEMNFNQ